MAGFLRDFSDRLPDLRNKSVLVTGATGSFGSTFLKHAVEKLNVGRLVVFSRDELKQYELQQLYPHARFPQVRFFIGDVRDGDRLKMATRGVDIIVHAAALKQVTAMEYNPFECVQTNIHGAENIVRAAMDNRVGQVIALSTDKAAEPVNLYGASKLVSDKIFVAANNLTIKGMPRFAVVRYGNVASSRGSVIPYFRDLIKSGANALPITDPRMTRFIITLDQGVAFVAQCLTLMQGGEIFIPKIPSIRIVDLAEAMAPGLKQDIVGIRPGEKLHEVLVPAASSRNVLEAEKMFVLCPELAYRRYEPAQDIALSPVGEDFSYHSDTNSEFLSVPEIKELLKVV
jgi:UDP-N-acetylglucosamine 4,6-dehydratase